jgi:hypothetical protein
MRRHEKQIVGEEKQRKRKMYNREGNRETGGNRGERERGGL